jgi:UDP-2,3-diacylglucosamine pyrophosphatase LpxH
MTSENEIAAVLVRCEEDKLTPPYVYSLEPKRPDSIFDSQGPRVEIDADRAEIFVVSDLHLASGRGVDGRYDGCENFFFDAAFHRFLENAHSNLKSPRAVLIINGDFIDFLRVTYVPGGEKGMTRWQRFLKHIHVHRRSKRIETLTDEHRREFLEPFIEWQKVLQKIGIGKTVDELVKSISDREEIYGLQTHDYKSVLRHYVVARGHPEFFDALAEWLGWGHGVIVVKGNHDLEWYWRAVRDYLRLDLAERLARQRPAESESKVLDALVGTVLPNLTFIDHSMVIDKDFYVEHGHPYDPLTRVIGYDTVKGGAELNIPFGSFFNRYLLNFIEESYPYLDNIRPTKNVLPLMLRHQIITGLRLLVDHLAVIVRTLPRQSMSYIFGQHLIWRVLLMLAGPLVLAALLTWHQHRSPHPWFMLVVEWLAWLLITHTLIQALAHFQLSEPDTLARFARRRFEENPDYRLITFGHTHNPDQFEERNRWFYNTGTWIPIVETTTADIRTDCTFTYVHLQRDEAGRLEPGVVQRWVDEAERSEPMILIRGVVS